MVTQPEPQLRRHRLRHAVECSVEKLVHSVRDPCRLSHGVVRHVLFRRCLDAASRRGQATAGRPENRPNLIQRLEYGGPRANADTRASGFLLAAAAVKVEVKPRRVMTREGRHPFRGLRCWFVFW